MRAATHVEGRPFREGEIAGSNSIADAANLASVDEQIRFMDAARAVVCGCSCGTVGEHNARASRLRRKLGL